MNEADNNIFNDDFAAFARKVNEAIKKNNLENEEHPEESLKKTLPRQDSSEYGSVALVNLNDMALTTEGQLTRTGFFENLTINREKYKDIVLTREEATSLSLSYRNLATGVNSVVPLICTAEKCPFNNDCWYYEHGKAPIGRRCLVEYDLLAFHTKRFMEELDVDPTNHTELMLVQELSELIIYEMRLNNTLAKPENATLMGFRTKFSPDGEVIEEEVEHWALGVKDKIKAKRIKILDLLMATRKSKQSSKHNEKENTQSYISFVREIKEAIANATEIPYVEEEDGKK